MGKAARFKKIRQVEKAAQASGKPTYQGAAFAARDYDMLLAGYRTALQLAGLSGYPQRGVERLLDIGVAGFLGNKATAERIGAITGMSDGMVQGFLAALDRAKQVIYQPTAEETKVLLNG